MNKGNYVYFYLIKKWERDKLFTSVDKLYVEKERYIMRTEKAISKM